MAEEELEQTTQQIDPGSEVDGIDQDPDQAGEVAEQNASTGGDDGPPPEECPPCKSGAPAWMATFADMPHCSWPSSYCCCLFLMLSYPSLSR